MKVYSRNSTYINFYLLLLYTQKKAALSKLSYQKWGNDALYFHLKLTKAVPTQQKPQTVQQNKLS